MTIELIKSYPRLWSLDAGTAMIVTDLHGDWQAFQCYRDRFVDLQAHGRADFLVFAGDLIHREPHTPDHSLEIVLDILALRAVYGPAIIYLCGNHELPHVYGFVLSRGAIEYTPAFESALNSSPHRAAILELFNELPFYIRTAAGVSITHAGASSTTSTYSSALKLFVLQHKTLLSHADALMNGHDRAELRSGYAKLSGADSYATLAASYLGITDVADMRYDALLRSMFVTGQPDFQLLRAALFSRCEQEYGAVGYAVLVDTLLNHLSAGFFPQRFLVTGHMAAPHGYAAIGDRHLRIASGPHAIPPEAGCYLLLDTSRPLQRMEQLVACVHSIASAG